MNQQSFPKIEKTIENFLILLRAVEKKINEVSKGNSLSTLQYEAMRVINQLGECSMRNLSISLNLSMASATQLIDRMITAGLVERKGLEKDRRVVLVTLSKIGSLEYKRISIFLANFSKDLFNKFSSVELALFDDLIERMTGELQ